MVFRNFGLFREFRESVNLVLMKIFYFVDRLRLSFAPEIRQTFELFDSDHDGKVSTKEISVIMRSLGMLISDKEMDELVARLDTDGQ